MGVHFVPWGSDVAPCGWESPKGDRDYLPLTDERKKTTCTDCRAHFQNVGITEEAEWIVRDIQSEIA